MKKSNFRTKRGEIIPFINRCDVLIADDEPAFRDLIGMIIHDRFPN